MTCMHRREGPGQATKITRHLALLTSGLRDVRPALSPDATITTVLGTPCSPGQAGDKSCLSLALMAILSTATEPHQGGEHGVQRWPCARKGGPRRRPACLGSQTWTTAVASWGSSPGLQTCVLELVQSGRTIAWVQEAGPPVRHACVLQSTTSPSDPRGLTLIAMDHYVRAS